MMTRSRYAAAGARARHGRRRRSQAMPAFDEDAIRQGVRRLTAALERKKPVARSKPAPGVVLGRSICILIPAGVDEALRLLTAR